MPSLLKNTAPESKKPDEFHLPDDFIFEGDLKNAYDLMENGENNLYITGKAGTGKSTLLNYFRKHTRKKYIVLSPTGIAAVNIGGSTIHSFFGLPFRPMIPGDAEIRKWGKSHPKGKIISKIDTIIIDEISMVRADILNAIDESLRVNTGIDEPFGNKQMVLIGDLFQLSPVLHNEESWFYSQHFESLYFFSADGFRYGNFKRISLEKIYRQSDEDFIYLLNTVRFGHAGPDELEELNKRFADINQKDFYIYLTTINAIVQQINSERLIKLPGKEFRYEGKKEGSFHEKNYPADYVLRLKEGAQVMLIKNDLEGRWINGSIGKIHKVNPEEIWVELEKGGIFKIEPVVWENKSYKWDNSSRTVETEVLGTFTQYPLKLAWAITIHKSQGLTFDKVIIDMGKGAFAHGQLYVALSRCRSLAGIILRKKLTEKDVIVDELVKDFSSRSH